MLYPLKFVPVYKDYPWGGRSFEEFGRKLPDGIVAESWEISTHPDGVSIVSEGELQGHSLPELLGGLGRKLVGTGLPDRDTVKFPLLLKFIDAAQNLSVQVHPDDRYAQAHENGEYGKNEMWYVMRAAPGAEIIYGVAPGVTRDDFMQAVRDEKVESCLHFLPVQAGDVVDIPAGLVHAVRAGVVIAEIQQNSNTTYRIYDYGRKGRALHLDKARDVIDFGTARRQEKIEGLPVEIRPGAKIRYLIANRYFLTQQYCVDGALPETADGSRFYTFMFLDGAGSIRFDGGTVPVKKGESVLIPACLGSYVLEGKFTALRSCVPDLQENVVIPLQKAGFDISAIRAGVGGIARALDAE